MAEVVQMEMKRASDLLKVEVTPWELGQNLFGVSLSWSGGLYESYKVGSKMQAQAEARRLRDR